MLVKFIAEVKLNFSIISNLKIGVRSQESGVRRERFSSVRCELGFMGV
jgi:3-deoxy-D-arabino-heptulosonate 7-phosphate (DAHP) synthase